VATAGTSVKHGDLYSGRMEVIKGSGFVNSAESSERFFREIRHTGVIKKEVNV
jgi:hypothetical protein